MADSSTVVGDMTSKVVQDPGLVSLGNGIYIKRPHEGASKIAPNSTVPHPDVILIFSWMGAQMPHILKYTKVYDDLYPSATQILVRSEASFYWSSKKTNRKNLQPVVDALLALGYISPKQTESDATPLRILVHSFSNGGSSQLSCLDRTFKRLSESAMPVTSSALVLDSTPGHGHWERGRKAFTMAIQNPILRRIAYLVFTFLFLCLYIRRKLVGEPSNFFARLREDLNRPSLLAGWLTKRTPRLYLYSDRDELVVAEDVEEHIEEAKERGFKVRAERFKDSKHVAHARTEPQRYWDAVQKVWEDAVKDTLTA